MKIFLVIEFLRMDFSLEFMVACRLSEISNILSSFQFLEIFSRCYYFEDQQQQILECMHFRFFRKFSSAFTEISHISNRIVSLQLNKNTLTKKSHQYFVKHFRSSKLTWMSLLFDVNHIFDWHCHKFHINIYILCVYLLLVYRCYDKLSTSSKWWRHLLFIFFLIINLIFGHIAIGYKNIPNRLSNTNGKMQCQLSVCVKLHFSIVYCLHCCSIWFNFNWFFSKSNEIELIAWAIEFVR